MNVLILHYPHPEGYPPTLNAINCIAKIATSITILSTDTLPTKWKYPKNVELILLPAEHDRFNMAKWSAFKKIKFYYRYLISIKNQLNKNNFDLVVIYDNIPFLFYSILTLFQKQKKVWYHSHDVYPSTSFKKFSLKWWASIVEVHRYFFSKIDFFSLPAIERKIMFPLDSFNGKFFFIPNYPSKNFIDSDKPLTVNENELRIVYPGSPSNKNGFKELIDVMDTKINSKTITLTIIGEVNPNYKTELVEYAKKRNVENQLTFVDRIPYTEMTHELKKYHIGWAVYKPVDLSVATAGSSSNKIYEFLANGIPIIVFDNEHHREYLEQCKAVSFCNLSEKIIIKVLEHIDQNFMILSKIAIQEFEEKYQFESVFNPVLDHITKSI